MKTVIPLLSGAITWLIAHRGSITGFLLAKILQISLLSSHKAPDTISHRRSSHKGVIRMQNGNNSGNGSNSGSGFYQPLSGGYGIQPIGPNPNGGRGDIHDTFGVTQDGSIVGGHTTIQGPGGQKLHLPWGK
jgi:hypothetical protein